MWGFEQKSNPCNCTFLTELKHSSTAREMLSDSFGDDEYEESLNTDITQRVILVAGSYRKEVTSTVLWLLNNGIDITCFKATPYKLNQNYLIDFKQIIPLEEAEDYLIKIAQKQKIETHNVRVRESRLAKREIFWVKFLEESLKISKLTQNLSPSKAVWTSVGLGMTRVTLNFVVTSKYARCEVYINRGDTKLNKETFEKFFALKENIESEVGHKLEWERMDDKVVSRIKWQDDTLNVFEESDHDAIIEFLLHIMKSMHPVFEKYIKKIEW